MTIKRWDGSSWISVDKVGSPTVESLVKVRRSDGWEIIWPPHVTHVAVNDGNWSDSSTWESGTVPGDGAGALIKEGVNVTLAQSVAARTKTLHVNGTFRCDPTQNTKLNVETIYTNEGSRFEIGTETDPIQSDVTAEIEFIDDGPIDEQEDPERVSKGLIVGGDLEIVGAEKTSWTTLDTHATQGETSITLSQTPTNWDVGDTIVLPGLQPYTSSNLEHEDEKRTISAVDGNTISFSESLNYDHVPPKTDLSSYALNLSRNVRFFSESTEIPRYGHFMVSSTEATIKYLETVKLGRTDKSRDVTSPLWGRGEPDPATPPNPRARYSIHFHRTDPTAPPHLVKGCSVRDTPGWGIVNHGSHAEIEDNVTYGCLGAGIVVERGNESGHIRRNFALRSEGSGEQVGSRKGWSNAFANQFLDPPHNIDDFGHTGHGFWVHSPIVQVEDNVAAGHRAHGFIYFMRSLYEEPLEGSEKLDGKVDMFPDLARELLTTEEQTFGRPGNEDPSVGDSWHEKNDAVFFSDSCRLRTFSNNEAFASGAGAAFRSVSYRNINPRFDWAHPSGFTAYNIGEHYLEDGSVQGQFMNFASTGNVGIDHRYVGNIKHKNHRLIGNGDGVGSSNNLSYINGWDVEDSTIENWEYGFVAKRYNDRGSNQVRNTTFDNKTDILVKGKFHPKPHHVDPTALLLENNSYNGDNLLEWEEINPAAMQFNRYVKSASHVTWEGRTVYHGWSDPNFVLVEEGDDSRLDKIMNFSGNEWKAVMDPDNPREVLPGATHQELYNNYGITFYGGMLDPADGETRSDFVGSGGTYDSTPFLGKGSKTMPTDEVWVDATKMTLEGEAAIISDASNAEYLSHDVLSQANNENIVLLESPNMHYNDDPKPQSDDGLARYEFDVDAAGEYYLYIRCHMSDDVGSNNQAVWRRFNDGDWIKWTHFASASELVWDSEYTGEGFVHPIRFTLPSGTNTLEIAAWSADVHLDWILIKEDTVAATPIGKGKSHTPRS